MLNSLINFFTSQGIVYGIGQIIGLLAPVCVLTCFQQKSQKMICFYQFLCSLSLLIHFFMIEAFTGSVIHIIGIIRAYIFMNKDKSWASKKIWLYLICIAYIIAGIITFDGDLNLTTWAFDFNAVFTYMNMLPTIAMVVSTVAFWLDNPKNVKLLAFPSSVIWIAYDIYVTSISGIVTETICMTSIIIGLLRYDLRNKKCEE